MTRPFWNNMRIKRFRISPEGLHNVIYTLHVRAHPEWPGEQYEKEDFRRMLRLLKGRETVKEQTDRLVKANEERRRLPFSRIVRFLDKIFP